MTETAPHRLFNVLYLCTGNSARSTIAGGLLNRLGLQRRLDSIGSGAPIDTDVVPA